MANAEFLAGLMAAGGDHPEVQATQTRFRLKLLERWQIPLGSRVLEVGCGQGDMTAVLADAVGESGRVTAVDVADPSYGGPVTLGESSKRLLEGPLGARIDFRFNFDTLDPVNEFPGDGFDFVVLAHCSWYFASLEQLGLVFKRIQPWARRLCYSEWDMKPVAFDQTAHLLAILIRGQVELHKSYSSSNVRTPFSRKPLREVLSETGWRVTSEEDVASDGMQDGRWEVEHCLRTSIDEGKTLGLPSKQLNFLRSQLEVLEELTKSSPIEPLPSYAISAIRTD